ncbi:MAG TPA: formylglycine-generating enzyme family protein [Bdellovibrio sp.]|uniref:formylglycine-generating enzyme family protein n=1 Tax=Bdellovibrio sp. TaxID=28201 RepID=UPI002F255EDA
MKLPGVCLFICLLVMTVDVRADGHQGMKLVPEGEFNMPAMKEKAPRKVKAFWMDEHAVTNQEFLIFTESHPEWKKSQVKKIFADKNYLEYWHRDNDFGIGNFKNAPVVEVSWFAARAYCDSLQKRLPTIEEWEYVGTIPFKKGGSIQSLILEWYGETARWPLRPVMQGSPNLFGLYDLHGVIWEWVEDFNSSLVTGESRADSALDKNLYCGSGAVGMDPSDYAAFMRYAFRSSLQAKYTVQNLGFRCVKDKE